MCLKYLIFCLSVAIAMAEPPVFMGLQRQDNSPLHANPIVYQQLPQEHSFGDFLRPSAYYEAPELSMRHAMKSADFEIPLEDSYNEAFLHSYGQQHQTGYGNGPTETQVHKHIYVHAPPKDFEQEDDIQPRLIQQRGTKQKHYKIVFIKAPEAPSVRAPIVAPLPLNEEKTLIYVLHKKPETHPNIIITPPEPTKPSKPEVYFIKYKSKRPEAPVYGPPPAFEDIQSRQADEDNDIAGADLTPSDVQQNELESTTTPPQYDNGMEQQQKQTKFATEVPLGRATDFDNASTESNAINEDIQTTTYEPINQYLAPETTLAPIVVKSIDETVRMPATTYGSPRRNRSRYVIKRRK